MDRPLHLLASASGRRAIGAALTIAGLVVAVTSGIALMDALDDDDVADAVTAPATFGVADSTGTETPAARARDPEDSQPEETVDEFVARFATAVRAGDGAQLLARLHPAVLDRYGSDQCAAYLPAVTDTDLELTVREVAGPELYTWETDEVGTEVDAAYAVEVQRVERGETLIQEIHLARVDGELHWFTDCGEPVSSGGG